jgi:hypothetical protein
MKKLSDISDKNPFKVPDNYFEEVNRKIISVTAGANLEIKKPLSSNRFRYIFLIAASFLGFILIGYTALVLFTPDKKNNQVSEVLQEINPDTYINDIDINALEEDASTFVLSEEGTGVSKPDIIEYLLQNNIDINDIYEQL